jgi:hypothetical protein
MLSNNSQNNDDQEREANLWRLVRTSKKQNKRILDEKYLILKTIGDGRYAK